MKLFVACKALIFNSQGQLLLLRESNNYQDGTNAGRYDVVGGRIEPQETLLEGLIREVKEESGMSVTVGSFIDASENFPIIRGEKVHIIRLYYKCTATDETVALSEDHDHYLWIEPDKYEEFDIMPDTREVLACNQTKLL